MLRLRKSHKILAALTGVTLVVSAASVVLYTMLFPPHFRGWGEVTERRTIGGWVVNAHDAGERVRVQLYLDGRFAGAAVADLPRPDVVQAGHTADERCGYDFEIPPLAEGFHEARVYAAHEVTRGGYRTLLLTGTPLRFRVDAAGVVTVRSEPRSSK